MKTDQRGLDFGCGHKGAGRDAQYDSGLRVELSEHAQIAVGARAGHGREPFRNFALHQQRQGANPAPKGEKAMQNRRGDVVGQIAEDETFLGLMLAAEGREVSREDVGLEDFNLRFRFELLSKVGSQNSVKFDGDNAPGSFGEKLGHRAAPRADFDDQVVRTEVERRGNPPTVTGAGQEMLAEFGSARLGHGKIVAQLAAVPPASCRLLRCRRDGGGTSVWSRAVESEHSLTIDTPRPIV